MKIKFLNKLFLLIGYISIITWHNIAGNPVIVQKVSVLVLSSVEEARRDSQPDIQDLAITLHKILVS